MSHYLKAVVFFMLFVLSMGELCAQTTSGVDADSRFIAIGVNGYDSANPLFRGADSYFSTNSVRDLGPSGDYSNISAYHLIGHPAPMVRTISDKSVTSIHLLILTIRRVAKMVSPLATKTRTPSIGN